MTVVDPSFPCVVLVEARLVTLGFAGFLLLSSSVMASLPVGKIIVVVMILPSADFVTIVLVPSGATFVVLESLAEEVNVPPGFLVADPVGCASALLTTAAASRSARSPATG